METLEGLADDMFNVLPIVTCSLFRYFLCVISDKNRIEELFHLCIIRRVCFFWRYDPSIYPGNRSLLHVIVAPNKSPPIKFII